MPTKIRLQRHGRKKYPFYHIVIADSKSPRDGKFIEKIGSYNPNTNPATVELKFDRALYWIQVGAQPTDTVRNILSQKGVLMKKHLLDGVKKGAFDIATSESKYQVWLEEKRDLAQTPKTEGPEEIEVRLEVLEDMSKEQRPPETRRQHYVPRTYMKHFANNRNDNYFINALPVSECKEDKIIEMNTINVCLEKNLYTLPGETTEQRMALEKFYSDEIESDYDKIYDILIDPSKIVLTEEERKSIIWTVVTMLFRTTKAKNMHNNLIRRVFEQAFSLCEQAGTDYFNFEGHKISIAGKSVDDLYKEYIQKSKAAQVLIQLELAMKLAKLRIDRDTIQVIKLGEENSELITSDNPVSFYKLGGGHTAPFDSQNILSLPLDNKHMLRLMPFASSQTRNMITRTTVTDQMCYSQKIVSNNEQFQNSERFLLGAKSALKGYLSTKEETERSL